MQITFYYDDSLDLANKGVRNVATACTAVQQSTRLKLVLQTTLRVGNTMNNGTLKGGARAIKLQNLHRLEETRATKNQDKLGDQKQGVKIDTLLDYVAHLVARSDSASSRSTPDDS